MEIASIYAQSLRTKTNSQYIPEGGSNRGFDEYINQAEARNTQQQRMERNDRSQSNSADRYNKVSARQEKSYDIKNRDNANQETQQPQNENAVKEEKSSATDESKASQARQTERNQVVTVKSKADKAEDMSEVDITEVNSQILLNLAQKLDIPVEEVTKLLENLNIQPLDLMDKEILGSFMRELFGVESNVELLNVSNVNETFALVNEALSEVDKSAIASESTETEQSVGIESAKDMAVNVDGEFTMDVSQVATKPEGSNNSNQNTGQNTNSSDNFAQTDDIKVNAEQINDENIVVTSENSNEGSRVVTKVETKLAGARTTNQAEVIKQVIEHVKTDVKGNVSEVKMLLKPESLGELSLKISIENGIITAQFAAENQRVKEIIESNFDQLKEALSQSGVEVGALSVSVSSDNENEAMHAYERERQKSAKRISKIIAGINSAEGSEQEINHVSQDDVLENQVNYTV